MSMERKYIIYKTTNLVNGKYYIGKHVTETPYEFDGYLGSGLALRNAIIKYGKENFDRETLFVFENEDECYTKEARIVDTDFVNSFMTYNICGGGVGVGSGENHPNKGRIFLAETRKKMSESHKGSKHYLYGKHLSEETKRKISEAHSGRALTEEHKQKIRDNLRDQSGDRNPMYGLFGEDNPNFGRKHSEETKNKISKSRRGKLVGKDNPMWGKVGVDSPIFGIKRSEETKKLLSLANKGDKHYMWNTHWSEKYRIKNAIGQLGKDCYFQRLIDIIEIDRSWGWKSKLARQWGIKPHSVISFLHNWEKSNIFKELQQLVVKDEVFMLGVLDEYAR